MNELSPQAKSLFARARSADQPAAGARTRVQHRLAARLAAGAAIGVGSAAAKSAWATWAPLLKTMAWVSLGASASLAAWHQASPLLFNTRTSEATTPALVPSAIVGPARQAVSATEPLAILPAPDVYSKPADTPKLAAVPGTDARSANSNAPNDPLDHRAQPDPARAVAPANAAAAARVAATPSVVTWPAGESPAPSAGGVKPDPGFVPPAPPQQAAAMRATGALSAAEGSDSALAASAGSLAAETARLREVQRAIRDAEPARALQLLDQDDTRFAHGVLAQERSAARVQALCKQGRAESARAEAARFEARWPRSVLLGRIRAECR